MRTPAMLLLFLSIGAAARAEGPPLDQTELDRRIVKTVYETALLGTEIYNAGKAEECLRLYQGALLALQPMLDHRPKLAASVKEKLDKAKSLKATDGAFLLRDALDEIQGEIAPGPKRDTKTAEPKKATSLWDRLGGETGVTKVVNDLIALAIEDKKVNLLRDGKYKLDAKGMAHFKKMLVEMVSEATGGPLKYTGKEMKAAHAGMKITADEFDALAELLVETLKKNKVAQTDIDELMKIVGATKNAIVEGPGN
jgi:hemoglobin